MGIAKKYSRAVQSSNLKNDEYHFDADSLGAVAMTAKYTDGLGPMLFRVKYANDAGSYKALLEAWKVEVSKKAINRKWPKHITANKAAELSLGYWLNDVCEPCGGKGYEAVAGTPMLSDTACKCCKGSGTKALVCEANWYDYIMDMVEVLQATSIYAGDLAVKNLASDMDF